MGPASPITFAGIELDSVLMEARLPHEKLVKFHMLILEFLTRKKVTLKAIQLFYTFFHILLVQQWFQAAPFCIV